MGHENSMKGVDTSIELTPLNRVQLNVYEFVDKETRECVLNYFFRGGKYKLKNAHFPYIEN